MDGRFSLVLTLILSATLTPSLGEGADLRWLTSYDEALAESRQSGRPIFVEYWADWCHYCKDLEASFEEPEFRSLLSQCVLLKINFDVEKDLVFKHRVHTLPTTLVIDDNELAVMRSVGRTPSHILLRRLRSATQGYPRYLTSMKGQETPSAMRYQADYLLASGNPERAERLYLGLLARMTPAEKPEQVEDLQFSLGLAQFAGRKFAEAASTFRDLTEKGSSEAIRTDAFAALQRVEKSALNR